jgi:endonuclease-3 related protein
VCIIYNTTLKIGMASGESGKKALAIVYGLLLEEYGEQGWWPIGGEYKREFKRREKTPLEKLEISIGALLAQNTSWENAQKAVMNLREAGLMDKAKLAKMREAEIASLIRPAGYYNMKARKIREFLRYSGEITREGLLTIWGCGEETADSILLYAYDMPLFVADAYSRRLFSRLGLCRQGVSYGELRELAHSALPPDYALLNEYHALIVEHAKRHCRVKPGCGGCPLARMCRGKGVKRGAHKRG